MFNEHFQSILTQTSLPKLAQDVSLPEKLKLRLVGISLAVKHCTTEGKQNTSHYGVKQNLKTLKLTAVMLDITLNANANDQNQ